MTTLSPLQVHAKGVLRLWPMAEDVLLTRQQDSVALSFHLLPHQMRIPSGQALIVEPWLCGAEGRDSLVLPTVGIYGRRLYYHVVRGGSNPLQDNRDFLVCARELPDTIPYASQAPLRTWMQQGVTIRLQYYLVDGCSMILSHLTQTREVIPTSSVPAGLAGATAVPVNPLNAAESVPEDAARPDASQPEQRPRTPQKSGKSYVDFIVNRIDLVPTLHNNPREIQNIHTTLDSLLADSNVVITRFVVTGYASPEGSYENNVRLAKGRSDTLCQYIVDQFGVSRDIITCNFVPEDWEGLRRYVSEKAWSSTPQMLRIMDTEEDPDRRLALIQQRFPREYDDIKKNALPYLRHSDYEIEYEYIGPSEAMLSPNRDNDNGSPSTSSDIAADTVRPTTTDAVDVLSGGVDYLPAKPFTPAQLQPFPTYRALFAVKTNLLFDAALCPNVEVEVPLGRDSRWSVMGEVWFPWWRFDSNPNGLQHKYYRTDQRPTKTAYELLTIGGELRYWLAPRCLVGRPFLSGTFVGIYGAGGKYDLGTNGKGDQGEFTSLGLSLGHSWALSSHWNLELSASAGYVGGPRVHYENEFDDTRLIYRWNNDFRYVGPTKLKLSLAWLIGQNSKKGGDR